MEIYFKELLFYFPVMLWGECTQDYFSIMTFCQWLICSQNRTTASTQRPKFNSMARFWTVHGGRWHWTRWDHNHKTIHFFCDVEPKPCHSGILGTLPKSRLFYFLHECFTVVLSEVLKHQMQRALQTQLELDLRSCHNTVWTLNWSGQFLK